jgi:hypothetical protein
VIGKKDTLLASLSAADAALDAADTLFLSGLSLALPCTHTLARGVCAAEGLGGGEVGVPRILSDILDRTYVD